MKNAQERELVPRPEPIPQTKKITWPNANTTPNVNKRRHQHDDLFHADIDALEREVNQFALRHRHIMPDCFGWELKSPFERPQGPLAPGLERFYARGNTNRLIAGFSLL